MIPTNQTKQHFDFIDTAKGLTILTVVFFHATYFSGCDYQNPFLNSVYTQKLYEILRDFITPWFMIPFFIVNGAMSNFNKTGAAIFKSGIFAMIVPMLILCFFHIQWFILALLIARMIYWWINKNIKKRKFVFATSFALFLVGIIVLNYTKIPNSFYVFHGFLAQFYIFIGAEFKNYFLENIRKGHEKNAILRSIISFVITATILCLYHFNGSTAPGFTSHILIDIIGIVPSIILAICATRVLFDIAKIINKSSILTLLGQSSLIIYFIHMRSQRALFYHFNKFIDPDNAFIVVSYVVGVAIVSVLISLLVYYIVNTKHLKWIVGKFDE